MFHKKLASLSFGRAFVAVVSAIFMLQLAGCSQTAPEADSFSTGQSVSSTVPVAAHHADKSAINSPYAGQEARQIKALSPKDIDGLLSGSGTPFGGMAKAAELNGYPGPRHVLDAVVAKEFKISVKQIDNIESLYQSMRSEAIGIGKEIIELETTVDKAFSERTMTGELLQENVFKSEQLRGRLRVVHLETHLAMVDILTPDQVKEYNKLRGYVSNDPCDSIPEGHSAELWKTHNNCT